MVRCVRWFLILLGGVLIGCGLTLHGQVALARHARAEVENTFVLWRAIGEATFYLQGGETRLALAMREVPAESLKESDRVAWVLIALGGLLAVTVPLWRVRQRGTGPAKMPAKPPAKGASKR